MGGGGQSWAAVDSHDHLYTPKRLSLPKHPFIYESLLSLAIGLLVTDWWLGAGWLADAWWLSRCLAGAGWLAWLICWQAGMAGRVIRQRPRGRPENAQKRRRRGSEENQKTPRRSPEG